MQHIPLCKPRDTYTYPFKCSEYPAQFTVLERGALEQEEPRHLLEGVAEQLAIGLPLPHQHRYRYLPRYSSYPISSGANLDYFAGLCQHNFARS